VITSAGNIAVPASITLGNTDTSISFRYDGTLTKWLVQGATVAQGALADTALQPAGSGANLTGVLKWVQGTQVTASGSNIDYTSLPTSIKAIYVSYNGLSATGTQPIEVQLGDSGGFETSGYVGGGASGASFTGSTSGFSLRNNGAGNTYNGVMTITLMNSATNAFTASGNFASASEMFPVAGSKSLSATLDRLRITCGSDTFDAGTVNIMYLVQT